MAMLVRCRAEDEVTSVVIATLCFTPCNAGSGHLAPIE